MAGFRRVAPFLEQLGVAGAHERFMASACEQDGPRDRTMFKAVFQAGHQAFGARLGVAIQASFAFLVGSFAAWWVRKAAAQRAEDRFKRQNNGVDPSSA